MSIIEVFRVLILGPIELLLDVVFSLATELLENPGLSIVVLSFAVSILVLPLYLQADAMQKQAGSVTAYFAMFTRLGMPIYGLRASAKVRNCPEERAELAAELLIIRVISGAAAWIVFWAVERLTFGGGVNDRLLMIFGVSVLAAIPDCTWFFKGMEEYRPLAWISAAVRLAGMAAVLLLVREPADIHRYAWITVLVPFSVFTVELILADYRWELQILPRCGRIVAGGRILQTLRKHIRPLALFMLMSCAVTVYSHVDIVMLGWMRDERTVGIVLLRSEDQKYAAGADRYALDCGIARLHKAVAGEVGKGFCHPG